MYYAGGKQRGTQETTGTCEVVVGCVRGRVRLLGAGDPPSASHTMLTSGVPDIFFRNIGWHGGPAPVRRYIPELLNDALAGTIDPGLVLD